MTESTMPATAEAQPLAEAQPPASLDSAESLPLSCALTAAASRLQDTYIKHYSLSAEDARKRMNDETYVAAVIERAPDQVSFCDLHCVSQHDEGAALRKWDEIKQAARDDVASGHRAAKAVEFPLENCWTRALFLGLRAELSEQWQPRNGLERQLIDTMVQAQTACHYWMERLVARSGLDRVSERRLKEEGYYLPPRVEDAKALDQAAEMYDRFNKIFLRSLRALRDLRRFSPTVVVRNANQVNVADQQVNSA